MTTQRIPARIETAAPDLPRLYRRACRFAERGRLDQARRLYATLEATATSARLKALVVNDLAAVAARDGDLAAARAGFRSALTLDPGCEPARLNDALLQAERTSPLQRSITDGLGSPAEATFVGCVQHTDPAAEATDRCAAHTLRSARTDRAARVAIVSFLFNWPSTGGGIVHTVELARFLAGAGYDVRHFHAIYPPWGIGRVERQTPFASSALEFDGSSWNVPAIQDRFRRAVDAFGPEFVIITDSWNMKPLLAEAVRGYPYFLRFQALECLCPLNNLRLLPPGSSGQVEQCPRHQLATPALCHRCLEERGPHSGPLHQLERTLAGVGTAEYDRVLRQALEEAEAVLVLNPLTEAMLGPYCRRVRVVPWGMDPARFPWPPPVAKSQSSPDGIVTLFMAAVEGEYFKGYHVLHEACSRLWSVRHDFELAVTFDPPRRLDAFTRSVGWIAQEEIPAHYWSADICVVPTIAQEGLSRTSVEAMAAGLPVIASRIGGLPYTVGDGATGLLCNPGDPHDLAHKIATLLDDPALRERMGQAGRRRFEQEFRWDVVIERYYRPLLARKDR